jgi:hypothetical protein
MHEDMFGNAAQEQSPDRTLTASANNYEIDGLGIDSFENLVSGVAGDDEWFATFEDRRQCAVPKLGFTSEARLFLFIAGEISHAQRGELLVT